MAEVVLVFSDVEEGPDAGQVELRVAAEPPLDLSGDEFTAAQVAAMRAVETYLGRATEVHAHDEEA